MLKLISNENIDYRILAAAYQNDKLTYEKLNVGMFVIDKLLQTKTLDFELMIEIRNILRIDKND